MDTEIIDLSHNNNLNNDYNKIKKYYLEGKLIAIPTETVYGLSADATNDSAVKKIYEAKGRPSDNPLIVHFYEVSQLDNIVEFNDENIKKLMDTFWPGPMTLVLPLKKNNNISKIVTANLETLAVRMPINKYARNILKETRCLLAAPSANISGKPSPTKYEHVYNDLNGKIDAIVVGEESELGLESTVIDCTKFPFVILRPGTINKEHIEAVLGKNSIVHNTDTVELAISPGMKYRHYSPDADFIILDNSLEEAIHFLKDKNDEYGFITYSKYKDYLENLNINIKYIAHSEYSVDDANKNLYNILRQYDKEKVKKIYMLKMTETEENKALLNRINKASSKK
ncbi:L-threonylcarbamoyladenylate synthase [Gemelliphila palaticanis]|uniref:Threonylcarbamoyl-AMP synthase n=1 Tax=Gemelliphila palaticanis TaxID=81950 RepID=A0ABX2T1P0_9BACL|nr:L-threonylcarbamoyladenylate synthase [Gemella palaticanis]MBF0715632.1 threonylcarbamoyl-AMP synthase [Gemella palaticanis]NYS47562.1 threonylcarbamoyl-AMP synthase [Gemella palaticanis]